ncbi:hypothetical protein BD779DRAFT_1561460 [Infundibulicybe gibba]|nr:hypothetical protein BD779DRAFT_1561460 [Infundibulicybe gibba]
MLAFMTVTIFLSTLMLALASHIPDARDSGLQARGDIPALLRASDGSRERGLGSRQTKTCGVGYYSCSDGQGCCRTGYYCGTWDGKLGCCVNGKSCSANDNPCDFQGDVLCAGENFCCPSGVTCSRDSAGTPLCGTTPTKVVGGNTSKPTGTKTTGTSTTARPTTTDGFFEGLLGGAPPNHDLSVYRTISTFLGLGLLFLVI